MLQLDDNSIKSVNDVVEFAKKYPMTLETLQKIASGAMPAAGDLGKYTCKLDDFKCVFSYEYHPGGLMRHLSVSQPEGYPNKTAVSFIAQLFGFKLPLNKCVVWEERPYRAINVVEPCDESELQ
jgi:hypothetical protein